MFEKPVKSTVYYIFNGYAPINSYLKRDARTQMKTFRPPVHTYLMKT